MSEPKKKRGRKPKNKIISNENPVFDANNIDNILITCIKKPKENTIITEDIQPHDNKEDTFQEYQSHKINKCWNCSYDVQGEIYSYPINYHNNLFHMNGNFCSYECAARYIYEKFADQDFWDKYYLLNFYVNLRGISHRKVNIPCSKLRLIDYGGNLTKDEYLKSNNISYDCYTPPCLYVNNIFYNKDTINMKDNEFKLFRRNKKQPNHFKQFETEGVTEQ
jgi:hypothetical protein